jgi:hypothetical protein
MKLPCTFLLLQLTADWQSDNMATVTNKRKVLSVEGKFQVRVESRKCFRKLKKKWKKKVCACREFDL